MLLTTCQVYSNADKCWRIKPQKRRQKWLASNIMGKMQSIKQTRNLHPRLGLLLDHLRIRSLLQSDGFTLPIRNAEIRRAVLWAW